MYPQTASTATVRVHSHLADGGLSIDGRMQGALRLWYQLRFLDYQGCGKVTFNILEMALDLGISRSTINRYLQNEALGLWRCVIRNGREITVYYSSTVNVCIKQGIATLGTVAKKELIGLVRLESILAAHLYVMGL